MRLLVLSWEGVWVNPEEDLLRPCAVKIPIPDTFIPDNMNCASYYHNLIHSAQDVITTSILQTNKRGDILKEATEKMKVVHPLLSKLYNRLFDEDILIEFDQHWSIVEEQDGVKFTLKTDYQDGATK